MLFFVAGITGNVGGAAARTLLQQGHSVRSLVRDLAKAESWAVEGVELREGDWNDAEALASALRGVDGAYLMMPPTRTPSPDFREAKALVAGYRAALEQTRPAKLVLLSSFGSEQSSGLGLITATYLLEQGAGTLNLPTAILRPGGFFENYLPQVAGASASGTLYSFYQPVSRKLLMVATEDIGATAARLLTTEWTGKRIVEIGDDLSPIDVAAALSQSLGKSVTAQPVPREHWSGALQQFGMPADSTWAFEEMIDSVNSGHIHNRVPGTEAVRSTISLEEFFQNTNR